MTGERRARRRPHARRAASPATIPLRCVLLLCAATLLLSPAALHAQDPPDAGERWSIAESGELVVIGQASPRRVVEIARDLSLGRAALLATAGAPDHAAPYPTVALLLGDDKTFQSYARSAEGAASTNAVLTALDRQGRVLALSLENVQLGLSAARQILAGDLLDQLLIAPPPWLRSGLAGVMARMEAIGGPGDPPRLVERVASATSSAAPADAATSLMRHLANPRSERSSQLRRYLTLLRAGAPSDAAFEECFFASFDAIAAEVGQVAARGAAQPIELTAKATPLDAARELPYDRAALALGELLLRAVPWNTVAAERHLRAALEREPNDAAALRGIALARDLDDRHDDATVLWQQSLAAAPDDRVTLLLAGWSRLDGFRRSVKTRRGWEDPLPAEVAAARELFARAMAPTGAPPAPPPPPASAAHDSHAVHAGHDLAPPIALDASPHALHGFGATYLFARAGFDPGIVALDRAAHRLPADDEIAADLILLHGHAGNQNLAWELRRERLLGRAAPELDAMVEKLLAEEALNSAKQLLLVDEKPDSAIQLLRSAAQEVRDPATRKEIETVLAQMEQVASKLATEGLRARFVDDYERARKLTAQRQFDEARRLIAPYATQTEDPEVAKQAREVLGMIDQVDR
jgi:hypothetical protein